MNEVYWEIEYHRKTDPKDSWYPMVHYSFDGTMKHLEFPTEANAQAFLEARVVPPAESDYRFVEVTVTRKVVSVYESEPV